MLDLFFRPIFCDRNTLSIKGNGCKRMPDGDCVALKVDGIPFHTEGLAAPHPIESTKENGDFKFGAFGDFKSLFTSSAS